MESLNEILDLDMLAALRYVLDLGGFDNPLAQRRNRQPLQRVEYSVQLEISVDD